MAIKVRYFSIFLLFALLFLPSLHIKCQANGERGLRTVVIDPGHGGKDPGAVRKNIYEKTIVLNIAKELGSLIKQNYPDVKVVYTRDKDVFITLNNRCVVAQKNNADLFVSIHCNANNKSAIRGTSSHILSRKDTRNPNRDLFEENLELTMLENAAIEYEEDQSVYKEDSNETQIMNALLFSANYDYSILFSQLVVENLACAPFRPWKSGIHQNDFFLLKKITCPAVLVETAFLSNPEEYELLVSDKWQKEIARRLFNAFKEYKTSYDASFGVESNPQPVTSPTDDGESYYGIQIMGLGRLLSENDPVLKGLKVQAVKAPDSNIYKYVTGKYPTKAEAAAFLSTVREKFPQAFIVIVDGNVVKMVK